MRICALRCRNCRCSILVLLRNVLLYFSQQDRRTVFREIHRKMAPGGYLVLGNAEQAEDSTNSV